MAVTYGFYNSVSGDRKYNAEQMAQLFDGIINDGVFATVGNAFRVSPSSGMVVNVASGRAWFNHTWTYNDDDITRTITTAPTGSLKRIDAIIIEVNTNTRTNSIKVLNGTADMSPVRPTLTQANGVYQYALAYITVNAGTTTITSSMIAGVVGTDTPYVTGPLETISASALYEYWDAEFFEWFDRLQDILDENVAANLQHQIDDINTEMSGKASVSDLNTLKSDMHHIGDIQYTLKSSLGTKWALCNGAKVEVESYPELCSVLAEQQYIYFNSQTNVFTSDQNYTVLSFMKYINGYYIAGANYYDGSTTYARIYYTTSLSGSWSYVNVWTYSSYDSNGSIFDVAYGNGKWVAVGTYGGTSSNYDIVRVAYSSSSSIGSSWVIANQPWDRTGTVEVLTRVTYANNTWAIVGTVASASVSSTKAYLTYASDITENTSWATKIQLWSGTSSSVPCFITYINNIWFVGGKQADSGSSNGVIKYASSLNGTWTTKNVFADSNSSSACVRSLKYLDNKYVAVGAMKGSSATVGKVAYATDYSGTWTVKEISWSSFTRTAVYDVEYMNGYWFFNCTNDQTASVTFAVGYSKTLTNISSLHSLYTNGRTTLMDDGINIVKQGNTLLFCNSRGYRRIDLANGGFDCNLPTLSPNPSPTQSPGYMFIRRSD